METLTQTIALLALCIAPVPLYAMLSKRTSVMTTVYLALLFAAHWFLYLTGIALLLGHMGALSRLALGVVICASYTPLLSRRCRSQCVCGIREAYQVAARVLSENKMMGAATAGLVLVFAYQVITTTTTDYDSMAYHIPFIFEWLQDHRFAVHPQYSGCLIGYYPCNWEAICALFVLICHSEFLLLIPNLVCLLLLIGALVGVGRCLNISLRTAWSAALLLCTTPIVSSNMLSLHVDLPLATFFLAALFFGLNMRVIPARETVWAFVLCMGMMIGIKTSGLLYAVLTVLLMFLSNPGSLRVVVGRVLTKSGWLLCLAFLLLGGSWYFRNLICFHYPFGRPVPSGGIFLTTLASVMRWLSLSDYSTLAGAFLAQCGPTFILAVALAVLLLIPSGTPRQSKRFLVFAMLATWFLYLTTPYSGCNGTDVWYVTSWVGGGLRYGFPLLGLLVVTMALAFDQSVRLSRVLQFCAFVLCVSAVIRFPLLWVLLVAILFSAALVSHAGIVRQTSGWHAWSALMMGMMGLLLCVGILRALEHDRARRRPGSIRDIHGLLTGRSITNLVYIEGHQASIFYGAELNTRVSFPGSNDVASLVSFMKERGASALCMGPNRMRLYDSTGIYSNLLNDERFRLVYGKFNAKQPVVFEFQNQNNEHRPRGK